MAVFQQNKQLNQLFKDAAQKGYVLSFTDEDGTYEEVKNAQEFLDLATDFELCFLWVKKNNRQNLFIGFISEYNPVVKDIEISVFNHSYDEELQKYVYAYVESVKEEKRIHIKMKGENSRKFFKDIKLNIEDENI